MATIDIQPRTVASATTAAMPNKVDVLTARSTPYIGNWGAIQVYDANFPNDTTSFLMSRGAEEEGVNLSPLNTKVPQADMTPSNFTKITIPLGNTMVIKAYRY